MSRRSQRRSRRPDAEPSELAAGAAGAAPVDTPGEANAAIEPSQPLASPGAPSAARREPMTPRSMVSGVTWPAVPPEAGALLLALQYQLTDSERWPPDKLERHQLDALSGLLAHACATVPFYGQRDVYGEVAQAAASGPLTAEHWRRLPVLTRADVQEAGNDMGSKAAPADHAPLYRTVTAGTVGSPLYAVGTRVTAAFWQAITLRDLMWHPRDVSGKLAAIRREGGDSIPAEGSQSAGWGPALDAVYETGPCVMLGDGHDAAAQVSWLIGQAPDYLLSYPTNLLRLAAQFSGDGATLPSLKGITSYGEPLTPEVRDACRSTWGVDVVDLYSTQEVGYIALQCSDTERYHVQSEVIYAEILDDADRPCAPGEVGRVVVSTLHNYAMPLFRYDLGDLAEVGPPCECGRTLPVLNRIVGRQ